MAELFKLPTYESRRANNLAIQQGRPLDFSQRTPTGFGPGSTQGSASPSFAGEGNAYDLDYQTNETIPKPKTGFSLGDYGKLGLGAAQAYLGYKNLGLQEDALDFSRGSFNRNLANQAQLINNEMEARQRARLETSGQYGRDEVGQAGLQSDLQSYLKPRQVSGKAI